jgi:NAD+ synthase (glutamine-hydrolysing)
MAKIKIGGAALNQIPMHWENNLKNIRDAVTEAKESGIKILCLPELCLTGYGCEDLFLSDWISEKAMAFLPEISPLTKDISTTIGLPVRLNGKTYNCVAVYQDGALLGITAKQFLANDGVHYEPRWFTPWTAGEKISIDINGQRIPFGDLTYRLYGVHTGFEICEDAWRENRPACRLVGKNIQLILNPSASHFAFGKSHHREKLTVQGSGKFHCYYVYTNLLGNEAGRMIYDGEIVIAGHGKVINYNEKLSFKDVNLISAEIDPVNANPESQYSTIPPENKYEIFAQVESLALFDYLRKSQSQGFVLSLSGGADSSTCAILVAEMIKRSFEEIGFEQSLKKLHLDHFIDECRSLDPVSRRKFIINKIFHCAYQGTKNSSRETLESAKQLALEIGANFYEWKIDDEVSSFTNKIEHTIDRNLTWQNDDITLQNIQSRVRAPIIWMLANIYNSLLLVTSNRSEGDVGYSTMDGDTSGSIAPIAAIDKYFILQWLSWAEKHLGYKSLSYVNSLNPTAELRPLELSQTDEDDLMPYHVIVQIEKLAIRDKYAPKEIFQKLKSENLEDPELLKSHIKKFFRLWCRNQWKRERTAPAFHMDDFNVDPRTWCRFPILSSGYFDELSELDDL